MGTAMAEPVVIRSDVLDEERAIMNGIASSYRDSIETAGFVYRIERAAFGAWMLEVLRGERRDLRELSVLDVGCGTGEALEALVANGCRRAIGFDLAEQMLDHAKSLQPDAHWVRGIVERPPFASAAFDVVVATFTLHHLYDPSSLFALIDHCLRPGGRFFLLEYGDLVAGRAPGARPSLISRAGDRARSLIRWKNRRALARVCDIETGFNSAHRPRTWAEIRDAIDQPERYELTQADRGVLLPAFKRVLVEDSGLDRGLARSLSRLDDWLAPKTGGYFQWISGRRAAA